MEEFQLRLAKVREAVDSVRPEKLIELQGRIQTYKEIIDLFTEI